MTFTQLRELLGAWASLTTAAFHSSDAAARVRKRFDRYAVALPSTLHHLLPRYLSYLHIYNLVPVFTACSRSFLSLWLSHSHRTFSGSRSLLQHGKSDPTLSVPLNSSLTTTSSTLISTTKTIRWPCTSLYGAAAHQGASTSTSAATPSPCSLAQSAKRRTTAARCSFLRVLSTSLPDYTSRTLCSSSS